MAGFCVSCGTPLTGAFCGKCGKPAEGPSDAAKNQSSNTAAHESASTPAPTQPSSTPALPQPAPVSSQAAVAAAKKTGGGQALAIGGIVLLFLVVAVAGMFYAVRWVKNKASAITGGAIGGPSQVRVAQGNACALLAREDAQQILGVNIIKTSEIMEGSDPGCAYYTDLAGFSKLQNLAVEQARRDSEKVSKEEEASKTKSDNPLELLKHTKEMEGMVKGLGLTQPDKEGRVFSFSVQRNFGRGDWNAVRASVALVPGFEEVPDVGDHAMIGSFGHAFYMAKGNNFVHMDTTYIPEARNRGSEIGRKMAARM